MARKASRPTKHGGRNLGPFVQTPPPKCATVASTRTDAAPSPERIYASLSRPSSPPLLLSPSSSSSLRAGPPSSTLDHSHPSPCLTAPSSAPSSASSTRTLRTEALSSPSRVRTSQSLPVTRGRARDTVSRRVMHQRCSDCESSARDRANPSGRELTRPSELSVQCWPSTVSLQTVTCS